MKRWMAIVTVWLLCAAQANAAETEEFDLEGFGLPASEAGSDTPAKEEEGESEEFDLEGFGLEPAQPSSQTQPRPVFASGPSLRLRGHFKTEIARDTSADSAYEDRWRTLTRLFVSTGAELNDSLEVTLSGRLSHALADGEQTDIVWEPELLELYLSQDLGPLTLHAGRRIVTWGVTELISPLNAVTPADYRYFIDPEPEETYLPATMLHADLGIERWRIEGIWIPFFEPSRFHTVYDDFALLPQSGTTYAPFSRFTAEQQEKFTTLSERVEQPRRDGSEGEYAARISTSAFGWDVQAIYISGYPALPVYRFPLTPDQVSEDTPPELVDGVLDALLTGGEPMGRYERRELWGLGFSTQVGDFVINGEAAYSPREQQIDAQTLEPFGVPRLHAIGGLEYISGEELFINVQYYESHLLGDGEGGREALLYGERFRLAMVFVRSEWLGGRLRPELRGAYLVGDDAWIASGRVGWRFSGMGGMQLNLGATVIEAPDAHLLAGYDANDQAFVSFTWPF